MNQEKAIEGLYEDIEAIGRDMIAIIKAEAGDTSELQHTVRDLMSGALGHAYQCSVGEGHNGHMLYERARDSIVVEVLDGGYISDRMEKAGLIDLADEIRLLVERVERSNSSNI